MKPLADILFSLYRGTPKHGDWIIACLEGAWPRLLGDRLAEACRPKSYFDSRLVIEIVDPLWEEALKSMKSELLVRLREGTAQEVRELALVMKKADCDS